jgi:hypothetical protein
MVADNKKISRAIALAILLIAATLWLPRIFELGSLSEADAKRWLRISDWLLVISAIAVVIGLCGEFPDSESWKKTLWYEAAKWLVIGGIFLELFGDAGVFQAGNRVQEVEDKQIKELEYHLAARTLTEDQSTLMVSRISKVISPDIGPIEYIFSATSDEEIAFAYDLSDGVFAKLGWDWKPWAMAPHELRVTLPRQNRVIGWIPLSGVQIQSLNPKLDGIVDAIVSSLTEVGIEGARTDPTVKSVWQTGPMMIAVMIGMRPSLALSSAPTEAVKERGLTASIRASILLQAVCADPSRLNWLSAFVITKRVNVQNK